MNNLLDTNKAIQQSLGLSSTVIYSTGLSILKNINVKGNVLDFGSGQGRFLKDLSLLDFQHITGVDLMSKPSDISSNIHWIRADLNHQLPCDEKSFDVIIAIEVIEHLENPRATIREWRRLLKPDGILIFSTPNNESIRSILSLIFRGHFVSFLEKDYPAHITALTILDMTRILIEHEFVNIERHFTNDGLVPGARGINWANLSCGLLRGKRFSDNVFMIAKKS